MFYKFNETHKYQPNRHYIRYWTRTLHANATMRKEWPINCSFEFCFFLYSFFLFTLKWNVMQQKKKTYTLVCIPWRNYQSLTDFLIDKSDFENTSRQISKVMYCLTVYVPCQCYCFWFNRNYFTHLVWPNLKPYHNLFWNALFKFLSWSFSMSYCISNLEHFRWQF